MTSTSAEQTASIKKSMQDEKAAKDEVIRALQDRIARLEAIASAAFAVVFEIKKGPRRWTDDEEAAVLAFYAIGEKAGAL